MFSQPIPSLLYLSYIKNKSIHYSKGRLVVQAPVAMEEMTKKMIESGHISERKMLGMMDLSSSPRRFTMSAWSIQWRKYHGGSDLQLERIDVLFLGAAGGGRFVPCAVFMAAPVTRTRSGPFRRRRGIAIACEVRASRSSLVLLCVQILDWTCGNAAEKTGLRTGDANFAMNTWICSVQNAFIYSWIIGR